MPTLPYHSGPLSLHVAAIMLPCRTHVLSFPVVDGSSKHFAVIENNQSFFKKSLVKKLSSVTLLL